MSPRRLALVAGVAVLVLALDRITKIWVEQNISLYDARPIVGEYVRIVHTQNTGAAFGLLPERTTLLSVLSVLAVLAIVYYYRQFANSSSLVTATLGMQLGGAFGNLLDRVRQGYVVDFVDVGIPNGVRFWAFNVADSSIVLGIIFVTLLLWQEERTATGGLRPPRTPHPPETPQAHRPT
jgi:signal peptidase II